MFKLQIESLNVENDNLKKSNHKLQKLADIINDEKIFLQTEVDRLNQDANIREINLRTEEERCSRLHEELLTAREELSKLYLSQDMLEQQRIESDGLIVALEKSKGDVKHELERSLSEQMNVQDSLVKLETIVANLEQEKKKLEVDLKKVCLLCNLILCYFINETKIITDTRRKGSPSKSMCGPVK